MHDPADGPEHVSRRRIALPIPAVAHPPFRPPLRLSQVTRQPWNLPRLFVPRQGSDVGVREHAVVNPDLVEVTSAHELGNAGRLHGTDIPRVRAELIEARVDLALSRTLWDGPHSPKDKHGRVADASDHMKEVLRILV